MSRIRLTREMQRMRELLLKKRRKDGERRIIGCATNAERLTRWLGAGLGHPSLTFCGDLSYLKPLATCTPSHSTIHYIYTPAKAAYLDFMRCFVFRAI